MKKFDELIEESTRKISELHKAYEQASEGQARPMQPGEAWSGPIERAACEWLMEIKRHELLELGRLRLEYQPERSRKDGWKLGLSIVVFIAIFHFLVGLGWPSAAVLGYLLATFDFRLNAVTDAVGKLTAYAMRSEARAVMQRSGLSTEEWHKHDLAFIRAARLVWNEYLDYDHIPVARDFNAAGTTFES